jgi:hypothetical protein
MKHGINWDALGIATSLACAIHCAILPLILSSLPLFGINIVDNIGFEYFMIFLAFPLARIPETSSQHSSFSGLYRRISFFGGQTGLASLPVLAASFRSDPDRCRPPDQLQVLQGIRSVKSPLSPHSLLLL